MSLIKPRINVKKVPARISLDEALLAQVQSYCDWAEIEKVDDFIEQAIEFVLAKDRGWKQFSNQTYNEKTQLKG
jgi:hypothetical protein